MADWKDALSALTRVERQPETETPSSVERKRRAGVVYSTNPNYEYTDNETSEPLTLPTNQQKLRLSMERAGRGGKTVTIVRGFIGTNADLLALAKYLKQKCGVGGAVKDGEVIIQGDHRSKILDILKEAGYTQTK